MENFRFVSKPLPESVENARSIFNSSRVYQIYLNTELLTYLENLLKRDIEWLRILFYSGKNIDELLNLNFNLLAEKLKVFKDVIESKITNKTQDLDEKKNNCIFEIDKATYECYICLVIIFTSKKSDELNSIREFAIESFSNIAKLFDSVLLTSKLDNIKNYLLMGFSKEIDWERANVYFKEHFYMFIPPELAKFPGFIHKILEQELVFNNLISNSMPVSQFESFIRNIFCSLETFEQFLQKNFFFYYLEKNLEKQYIFLSQLQKDYPDKQNFKTKLQITESRSAKYKDRIYEFNYIGLQRVLKDGKEVNFVRRSFPDYLVLIGSERSSNFFLDIQIIIDDSPTPNVLIFINRRGLNIIDISPFWSVKVQFSSMPINKNLIFAFGRSTFIQIQPFTGVCLKEKMKNNVKTLIFHIYDNGELNIIKERIVKDIAPNEEFKIGNGIDCQVDLKIQDIQEVHACIRLGEKGDVIIEDSSKGNSFYLLKNKKQIIKRKASRFLTLKQNTDFFVKNVRFKVID